MPAGRPEAPRARWSAMPSTLPATAVPQRASHKAGYEQAASHSARPTASSQGGNGKQNEDQRQCEYTDEYI